MEQAFDTKARKQLEINDETASRRRALFEQYVTPHCRMVYKLCIQYSFSYQHVADNYCDALTQLYKYIETYNPEKPLLTWLHIVTKRCVYDMECKRRAHGQNCGTSGDMENVSSNDCLDDVLGSGPSDMSMDNYEEVYNDDILGALNQLKPSYKRMILYQQAGYSLKEIAEMEFREGSLDSVNVKTVKSRLFWARKELRKLLTRDGKQRILAEED